MPNDSFAIRLREARRMRKLSMDKLVELADFVVTKQSLSRYERGVMRPHANVLSTLGKPWMSARTIFSEPTCT